MRLFSSIIGSGRGPRSTLNAGITAFWQLGSTADTVGVSTLTNNSSVSFANDGPVAGLKCATFSGTNWLSCADNAALSNDTSTTLAGWFYLPDTSTGGGEFISKWFGSANEYRVDHFDTSIFGVIASSSDAGAEIDQYSANTWHSFITVFDAVGQTVQTWGDNQDAFSAGPISYSGGLTDSNGTLGIGAFGDGTTALPSTARLYGIGLWKKAFTPAERTEFHNGGVAKIYPF